MKKFLFLLATVVAVSFTASAQHQRFVKQDATGTGASWDSPSGDLQAMIDEVNDIGEGGEIWVAAGTYYPTIPAGWAGQSDPRNRSFLMRKNVKVYGGFAGGETSIDARDLKANETILSGDLNKDGIRNVGDAYHVVVFAGDLGNSTLDGFTVTGAYAVSPAAEHTVIGEYEIYHTTGAGIYLSVFGNASPVVFTLNNLVVKGNESTWDAGGILVDQNSTVELTNSIVTGNVSGHWGGGIGVSGGPWGGGRTATLNAKNSLISRNTAARGGAIYMNRHHVNVTLTNMTLAHNDATEDTGYSIYALDGSNPTTAIYNITIQNTVSEGDVIIGDGVVTLVINNSMPKGWDATELATYGANNLEYTDPLFNDDYTLKTGSPLIDAGNNAYATGIEKDLDGKTRIVNSTIDIGAYEYDGSGVGINVNREEDTMRIWSAGNTLYVNVENATTLDVYSASGVLAFQKALKEGEFSVELPAGFYIVKTGNVAQKVLIK
ncbi:MAG: choice-of-anchor Q domain-containing protein [Dysgonomonas sp.]